MFLDKAQAGASAKAVLALPIKRFIPVHGGLGNSAGAEPDAVPTALELLTQAFSSGGGPLA
jgi:hypothetical protein